MPINDIDKLAELIKRERDALLSRWRQQVKELPAAKDLDIPTLNDHLPQLLDELAAALQLVSEATYLVVLVAPLQESISRSPVVWSSLLGLVRERNKLSRAAILSFDPSVTVRSVIASRNDPTPFAIPADHGSLRIEFSPFGERVLESTGRKIVIGLAKQPLHANQVLLPAGLPGMHHAGIVIRGDGSVTLPLQAWSSETASPTPAGQLRSLLIA